MAKRLQAMGHPSYLNGFDITCHEHLLELPLTWRKPKMIFVNSMSDLFHESIPDEFIIKVFQVMNQAHWHTFQVLTKRAERLQELSAVLPWTRNIWMGVTVENQRYVNRINNLKESAAFTKFISMEPLIGPIEDLDLRGIDWVIVGGESGPGSRPMDKQWVLDIQTQCEFDKAAFFFKQWGGVNKKKAGRLLQGKTWDAMPKRLAFEMG
jgi:protein gp37